MENPEPERVALSLKQVAVASGMLTVTSIATLVVVLAIRSADALASIALALAILSFLVQIVFYVVQVQAAGQQVRASEQINVQTRELLAEIRLRTASLESTVGGQMGRLWDWLLAQYPGVAKEASETVTVERARGAGVLRARGARRETYVGLFPERRAEDVATLREIRSPLSEDEKTQAKSLADSLDDMGRTRLMRLLGDEITSRHRNGMIGLPYDRSQGTYSSLIARGLVQEKESPWLDLGDRLAALTPLGRLVARYGREKGWMDLGERDRPAAGEPPEET